MTTNGKYKWVGTRPIRHDGVDKVIGKANYGADLSFPDMLWGKLLRSPHAHANIKRIDVSKALKIDGVKAVLTAKDLPDLASQAAEGGEGHGGDFRDISLNCMARDKVVYHGHAVAAVAATSQDIADLALAAIEVEYEVLKPVLSIDAALAKDAPILHPGLRTKGVKPDSVPTNVASRVQFGKGDIAKGFSEAEYVIERTYRTQTVHQGYIEPHAVVARTNADGQSIVWCCTQGAFMVRSYCAAVLGLDVGQLKVIPSEIGGGFGGKTTVYTEPIAIALSRKTGRPVKMVMSREDVFRATGPAGAATVEIKLGAKKDGTLVAAQSRMWFEAGGFPGSPVGAGAMTVFAAYDIPHSAIEGFDVVTTKPKTAAYRAPGAPQAAFGMEQALDELAAELRIDPIDLRIKNAAKEGVQAPYGAKFSRVGFVDTLEAAKKHPHYRAPLGPNQGRGIASGFWFNVGMQSSAEVHLAEDGAATVITGNPDIGGSRASMAICAAEELGIDVAKVRPIVGDTDTAGYCDLTGGSRVTYATGMAVIEASRDVIRQLRERAAKMWGCDVALVEFSEGRCQPVKGSGVENDPLTVAQIAAAAGKTGGPINGRAQVNPPAAGPGFATHLCDVQVDPDTGRVDVIRYTTIQDAGKAVHPSYVEGQMQGGASQGIGWALNEEYVFDKHGVMENAGFLDYRMPVASDLPMIDTVVLEIANPLHPYGVRGVGEVPIVPPLATVANAVKNATGVRMTDLPISPPKLLAALQARS
ncbi:MAG: xanthine dehydrogenase family protein molybdopterin-binding subunit [Deltaproteobacteria bacterium]|nr:xanthine dehydrogenase family protein molybdopterin-binding subunit [Deltaproteobacteria bacterium]